MTALRRWLLALLLTAVAVAVCYLWIDRPLALLVHAHSAQRETFARLTYLPDLLIPLAAAAFVAFGLWALAGRCLLYTSDAADDLLCVDLGGRRIIKKKNTK